MRRRDMTGQACLEAEQVLRRAANEIAIQRNSFLPEHAEARTILHLIEGVLREQIRVINIKGSEENR